MSAPVQIIKQGFMIAEKCVEMYQALDSTIPWKPMKQKITTLDKYSRHYSIKAAEIVGTSTTLALNAFDSYFRAKLSVFEMCGLATRLIPTYKVLFDKHEPSNFPAQKQLLLTVLDSGMEKMSAANVELVQCSASLDLVTKELSVLLAQLTTEFGSQSESATFDEMKNFYESLKVQFENASTEIKNAGNKLDSDIEIIRVQNTAVLGPNQRFEILDMNELHDEIIDTLNDFSKRCKEFEDALDSESA